MILNQHAREYYELNITTTPPIQNGWEASFDGGHTWTPGDTTPNATRWLIRGPATPDDPTTPSALVPRTCTPLIRAKDTPEIIVRATPTIAIT